MDWEEIIESSFGEFDNFLKKTNWYGRENEVVNIFALKFLSQYIGEGNFTELSQIGIEVAVRQVNKKPGKELVRKDLVIWDSPDQTVWNSSREPKNVPAVIVEWKRNKESACDGDIEWIEKFTSIYTQTLGYSVCAFIDNKRGLSYVKVRNGRRDRGD